MTPLRHPLTLLSAAVLVLALVGPAAAQVRADRSNDRRDESRDGRNDDSRYGRDFNLDRNNERTYRLDQRFRALGDQQFQIRGDLHVVLNVRESSGDLHIDGRANAGDRDLIVTRLRDNEQFRLVGTQDVDVTIRDARSRNDNAFRHVLDFRAVSDDAGDYRVRLTLSGRVQSNGVVNAEITGLDLDGEGRANPGRADWDDDRDGNRDDRYDPNDDRRDDDRWDNDGNRNDRDNDDRYGRDFDLDGGRNERTYRLNREFRALGDQQFRITGEVHATLNVREDNSGDVHIDGRANGSDLVVTRLRDGQQFRLTGTQNVDVTIRDARSRETNTFRHVLDFNAVSRGSEPDYRVRLEVTGRVQRGGAVHAEVTGIELDRR